MTFRELESWLRVLAEFFEIERIPDANTISRSNRSPRFAQLLRRFHRWILEALPERSSVVATDATGYSNRKAAWSETDYGLRATQDWLKSHCVVELPTLLYLNTVTTKGRVHESQVYEEIWSALPSNVRPTRSLADAAYGGEDCLRVAHEHDVTPLHGIRKDARHKARPESRYQKLVNFATHWPNRFARLTGHRSLIETTFNSTKQRFGHRLRCRHPIARRNEIQAKQTAHNIRVLTMRDYLASS
ncbi:MAG: transposase [Thermoplasmatota archaeon]